MTYEIVPLNSDHLDVLFGNRPVELQQELTRSYFSPGSRAECLLADGFPICAAGIVNMGWNRGEAWVLTSPMFREHLRAGVKAIRKRLPIIAARFRRVQATCMAGSPTSLIRALGFEYEATLKKFGNNGESCRVYARFFEEQA